MVLEKGKTRNKFLGSLLGAAIGDAVGATREGHRMVAGGDLEALANIAYPLCYTDDTHMTIGVAESLVERHCLDGAHMAERFVDNYLAEPWRGYGPGPPRVFRLIRSGQSWDTAASNIYEGGSYGNGAAMRVSPIGLFFSNNLAELKEAAYLSSLITHSHILGKEGAALQAAAVAFALVQDPNTPLDKTTFKSCLLDFTTQDIYRAKIEEFTTLLECFDDRQAVVEQMGNGIEAFNSVPTAIFSFLAHPQDFQSTVIYAVSLGGDTDTIASMAGAISGAYLGVDAIPLKWQKLLENGDYILNLAERLWQMASTRWRK
jgi:poly(ADP-ribose) glycohydrolase ARH3